MLDQLDSAIRAVGGVDVDAPTESELDELVIGLQRARHRLAGVTAGALARWDRCGVWRSDGCRSAGTRLARDASTSTTTAHIDLRRARKLADMRATAAAVCAGRVSMDHVDLLARADHHRHHLFARDEELLVEQCATLRHAQAVKAVEYWAQLAESETGDSTHQPPTPVSSVRASTTIDGTVRIDGTLDQLDGAIVTGELSRLERAQHLADQAAGIARSHSERLAAALVEMATRSASTPADAQRPKPLFSVLLGDDSLTRLCELANGTVISPDVIVPHLGAAEMETILFDGPFTVIAASGASSSISV